MKKKFIAFLKQGLSPRKLALCVALGCVLGVFPVLGSTTILCAAVAWVARLNQPAIQTVNYLIYPLQWALLIPFYRMGQWLFRAPPVSLTWSTTLHAIAAWSVVAPFAFGLLYMVFLPLFRRLARPEAM